MENLPCGKSLRQERVNGRHSLHNPYQYRAESKRVRLSALPTTSSSMKKIESITSRMMILLDFEIPIFRSVPAGTCGQRTQQALTESCDGDERWTEEQILRGGLNRAFSGLSIGSRTCADGKLLFVDGGASWDVAHFSNIWWCGPCMAGLVNSVAASPPIRTSNTNL